MVCRVSSKTLLQGFPAGILIVLLEGCSSAAGGGTAVYPPPPEVDVATVVPRPVQEWDEFNGRVSAIQTVVLRPRVSGYIQKVIYKEGTEVRRGDLLFIIDPRPYRDALNTAHAQLERARAVQRLARLQDERARALIGARAISREELDNRRSGLTQGDAAVREAEAAVATAELNLSFTGVRAPISGRTGRAMLTSGNLAQADQTELTTIVPQDPMYVYFDCDEHSFLHYKELARKGGQAGKLSVVRVALADDDGFSHAGTLDFLDNQVDPSTGTIRVRAVLPNPDRVFTPGLYARVRLGVGGQAEALLIDDKAVMTDQDHKYVYVLSPDNRAVRKDVILRGLSDGLRVVQSGLQPGDRMIINGLQAVLFPGMTVKPVEVAMRATTTSAAHTTASTAR